MRLQYTRYTNKNQKDGIIVDGYTFYSPTGNASTYRCSNKECTVRAYILDDLMAVIHGMHSDHKRNADKILKRQEISRIAKKFSGEHLFETK